MEKRVCFIGHRNVPDTEELRNKIQTTVERLITKENVTHFLFGSRSNFDSLCHDVVTELQAVYPGIQRVAYTCRHECATMREDKEEEERICILRPLCHRLWLQGLAGWREAEDSVGCLM